MCEFDLLGRYRGGLAAISCTVTIETIGTAIFALTKKKFVSSDVPIFIVLIYYQLLFNRHTNSELLNIRTSELRRKNALSFVPIVTAKGIKEPSF